MADYPKTLDPKLNITKPDNGAEIKLSITINGTPTTPPKRLMTGLEIKQLGGRDSSSLLILIDDSNPSGEGKPIDNGAQIPLKNNMKFRLINSPTLG